MQVKRSIETVVSPQLLIELPESFMHRQVEILVIALDQPEEGLTKRRRVPPPQFAGKVKELGDIMVSVPLSDWGMD